MTHRVKLAHRILSGALPRSQVRDRIADKGNLTQPGKTLPGAKERLKTEADSISRQLMRLRLETDQPADSEAIPHGDLLGPPAWPLGATGAGREMR